MRALRRRLALLAFFFLSVIAFLASSNRPIANGLIQKDPARCLQLTEIALPLPSPAVPQRFPCRTASGRPWAIFANCFREGRMRSPLLYGQNV